MPPKKSEAPKDSQAVAFMRLAFSAATRSWSRFNQHLRQTLQTAIVMEMHFEPDDFTVIAKDFRAGYWWTENPLYQFYRECIDWNPSALKALEKYWGLEAPFIYETERDKPGKRLTIGSTFHWQGGAVKVTSIERGGGKLVACAYHDKEERTVKLRYSITPEQMKQERQRCAKAVKGWLKEIEGADLERLSQIATAGTFNGTNADRLRHIDIETLFAAFTARRKKLQAGTDTCDQDDAFRQGKIRWVAAVKGRGALLRLSQDGKDVETSNGHSAPAAHVKTYLGFALETKRKKRFKAFMEKLAPEISLGGHTLQSIDGTGVKIGCTFFEWPELEKLNKLIAAAS